MARITVEDCLKRINSQYDLVLLAKERTAQLNVGDASLVDGDNDKNTVIALREIGEGKVSIKTLEDSAINRLRIQREETATVDDIEEEADDNFDKIYKGEVSKSGTAILPSKRIRRIPEKNDFKNLISENKDNNKSDSQEKQEESKTMPADNKSE